MKTKSKVIIGLVAISLSALLLIGLTIAYLTDQRIVTNTIGVGVNSTGKKSVMISLEELSFAAHADSATYLLNSPDKEIRTAAIYNLLPGDRIYKDPVITNSGGDSVYLRVKINMSDALVARLTTDLGLVISTDFVKQTDGYYYYVDAGGDSKEFTSGTSVPFFVTNGTGTDKYSMAIPVTWTNGNIEAFLTAMGSSTINLEIQAEAIQYSNFDGNIPWVNEGTSTPVTIDAVANNYRA